LARAARDDPMGRLVGEAWVVRDAFEQLPMILMGLAGPDHRVVAMNAACRAYVGRSDVIGLPVRAAFPDVAGQQLYEFLDQAYASGQPQTRREWRAQIKVGSGEIREIYADFTIVPWRAADGTISGLLVSAADATERVQQRQAAQEKAADAERSYQAARDAAVELQEALLPTALPVLPRARVAARYLVAGHEQAAGGDWFDAIPLGNGRIALIVGDVVGHGVAASAAMGQLRAVLAELFAAEPDLARVLERATAFAARTAALRAATLAVAVLHPAEGTLRYTTCGHPPPLVVAADGATRFLEGSPTGPLGTGSAPILLTDSLGPGELLLLYSDGLIERPNRTITEGMAELARVAAAAAANQALAVGASRSAAERVCQLTVELLTRTGYADDVTALAVHVTEPVPAMRLELLAERPSLAVARQAFGEWLDEFDATQDDRADLHLAMVEIVTNAIEHAYSGAEPGSIEITAELDDDGIVTCQITDHGTWRQPDPAEADRGHGLMVAGQLVDTLTVTHRLPREGGAEGGQEGGAEGGQEGGGEGVAEGGQEGTAVTLRRRLRRPAILGFDHRSGHAVVYPPEPPFEVETTFDGERGLALIRGSVDITTADMLVRRLLSASRGGTVSLLADLTGVTQLASAGVRALYQVRDLLAGHKQHLTLVAAAASSARMVLDLVQLPHTVPSEQRSAS
jgi:serine phosphatase RsbU (regulator of sigma subunit)/anti-sigma regulatory factor (Ser/Thr protein kinase)/anti-anti-sigma regulatory factor